MWAHTMFQMLIHEIPWLILYLKVSEIRIKTHMFNRIFLIFPNFFLPTGCMQYNQMLLRKISCPALLYAIFLVRLHNSGCFRENMSRKQRSPYKYVISIFLRVRNLLVFFQCTRGPFLEGLLKCIHISVIFTLKISVNCTTI